MHANFGGLHRPHSQKIAKVYMAVVRPSFRMDDSLLEATGGTLNKRSYMPTVRLNPYMDMSMIRPATG